MSNPSPAFKEYNGPILFERGYRPFFLGAALFAGVAIPFWVISLKMGLDIPTGFSGRNYHIHEMIFGYLGAVLAGFLFTAMPNWTGQPALAGIRLGLLSALWLAGRIAILTSASWPITAAVIDATYLVIVGSLAWRDVVIGGSVRNMPVCFIVSLLAVANISYHVLHLQSLDTAWIERAALGLIAVLISLVGGRVVPNFSGNWMRKNKLTPLPAAFSTFDKVVIASTIVTVISWVAIPEERVTGYLFACLFIGHATRLFRWRGWKTMTEPLVFILHMGYLWLVLWFGLSGLALLVPDIFSNSNALHALTSGAVGTMTMAIMTRAILGHSGRKLHAGGATQLIYALITAGALIRVFAESFGLDYMMTLSISGTLWAAGFILFALVYGPYCFSKN